MAKKKKEMNFKNQESLQTVVKIIEEADSALNDKSRTIATSSIPEVLTGALGVGVGAGVGFAARYLGGSVVGLSAAGITSGLAAAGAIVGGGMAAGLAVLAAPAVVLGGVGVGIASHIKHKKLKDSKLICYKEALKKQSAIIKALHEEATADKERIDYLNSLNIMLQAAIRDLEQDLQVA